MVLGVRRGEQLLDLPVTPTLSADGTGRIGVQLTSNLSFTHAKAASLPAAAKAASVQLARCFGVVLGGEPAQLWNTVYAHSLVVRSETCLGPKAAQW